MARPGGTRAERAGRGGAEGPGAGPLFTGREGEHLAWLGDGDEDEEAGTALDPARILRVAVGGIALVAALVAGAFWLAGERPGDPELVPDGSVIEAPEEPYKVRPADPGGREMPGTGDTSFAVAEGQTREGRIDSEYAPAEDGEAADSRAGGQAGAIGVQVGAFPSPEAAREGWTRLRGRMTSLDGRSPRIIEGRADSGTIYWLQASSSSAEDARALCRAIRAEGGDCEVKL